jgi:glyoxylase-like metal-dependent hydrolase (beta-lactamase superfamily II)
MKWTIIPTGRVWVDPGGALGLVPKPLWIKYQPTDEFNRVPMDLNSVLIEMGNGEKILIDTGLGDKLSDKVKRNWALEYPEGTLIENLAKLGVSPADISMVINTHLHSDHCGGNTTIENGELHPTFPNAKYWVQRIEFADALHPDARTRSTYLADNIVPIWKNNQFEFQSGDTKINEYIRCVVTPGHTKSIQCIIIEDIDTPPVMFMTDLTSFALHMMKTGWVTAYDVFPLETIRTKTKWQKWVMENDATLIFQHDIHTRIGKLYKNEKGRFEIETVTPGSVAFPQNL